MAKAELDVTALVEETFEKHFGVTLDRLRELAEADKDGRLAVLPCKESTKLVYDGFEWNADHWNIGLTATRGADTPAGYTVRILDIEQAESALRGEER